MATSVTMSARAQLEDPNNEYLGVTEKPGWELLEKLSVIDEITLVETFRSAIK